MKTSPTAVALPPPITAYWTAANAASVDEAAACFSAGAVVHDEGQIHTGHDAIRAWIDETTRRYRPVVTPHDVEENDGRHLVSARVSGTFPGSPAELRFAFTLERDQIARLEVVG